MDALSEKARLNAAVYRARLCLRRARAFIHDAKREAGAGGFGAAAALQRLRDLAVEEVVAEQALRAAVDAWARDGHRLSDELRRRRGSAAGCTYAGALASLTARFGAPWKTRDGGPSDRGAYWSRDSWSEDRSRGRDAWRSFGVCVEPMGRDGERVRIFGSVAASGPGIVGHAAVDVVVGAEPRIVERIAGTYLPRGAEYAIADPGPYPERRSERADDDEWLPWSFDAPATAEGLVRCVGQSGLMLAPLPLAVEAVALMLDVPRRREEAA